MSKYDLSHLTQDSSQNVWGPIQDDEALFLYSIIRGCRMSRILEIGGLSGYSAKNFLKALEYLGTDGIVYTCDINPVPKLEANHVTIIKNALDLTSAEIGDKPVDMVFFDCHDWVQMEIYKRFVEQNIINDDTVIALHDTNLHYPPWNRHGRFIPSENGYAHQPIEREMTNIFKDMGYDIFSVSTDSTKHSHNFPIRHGLSICRKFKKFSTDYS